MSSERATLGSLAVEPSGLVDGPFGSNLPASAYQTDGIPVIRGNNLTKGEVKFKLGGFAYVSDDTALRLSRSTCVPRDIIFTKKGTLGQVGYVPSAPYRRYLLSSNQMRLRVDPAKANSLYVYYALSTKDSIERLIRESEHTGVPKINLAYLRQFEIPLPALADQNAIARFISVLDDRIDNLRATNATLEAIAQALFKSWFVDFDPVHAKAEGRAPTGMDAATAALFPSEFEDSELGSIPKGWRVAPFDDLVEIAGGGTPKTSVAAYWGGTIPWFSVVDAPDPAQIFTLDTAKKITELGLANCSATLLPERTTIISARGTVGKVAMTGVPMAMNQSCYALRAKFDRCDAFVYFLTLHAVTQLQRVVHGAVFDTITRSSFQQIHVPVAGAAIGRAFATVVDPLLDHMLSNGQQAVTLARLRDTLLPRLISGKLRLPDVERALESAA